MEQRFIALLGAEPDSLPRLLRQTVSLLAADGLACDYASLLEHLARWFNVHDQEKRDRLRQHWARDFYRAYEPPPASSTDNANASSDTESTL